MWTGLRERSSVGVCRFPEDKISDKILIKEREWKGLHFAYELLLGFWT